MRSPRSSRSAGRRPRRARSRGSDVRARSPGRSTEPRPPGRASSARCSTRWTGSAAQLGGGDLRAAMERYRAAFEPLVRGANQALKEAGTGVSAALDRRLRSTLLAAVTDRGLRADLEAGRLADEHADPRFAVLSRGPVPARFFLEPPPKKQSAAPAQPAPPPAPDAAQARPAARRPAPRRDPAPPRS